MTFTRSASCNCGAVRITARGDPVRVGLCHCTTCRKESGAPFTANTIWRVADIALRGKTMTWKGTTDTRHFCPSCGSTMFSIAPGSGEIEVRLGAFDEAPTDLVPTYELWVVRREKWLPLLAAEQYEGNR